MKDAPMMVCGCIAQATMNGEPACAIHVTTEQEPSPPDLTGRTARCDCGKERPSLDVLGLFFEYQGPGSPFLQETCGVCKYHLVAHGELNVLTGRPGITDHEFVPRAAMTPDLPDRFYCGHAGWD